MNKAMFLIFLSLLTSARADYVGEFGVYNSQSLQQVEWFQAIETLRRGRFLRAPVTVAVIDSGTSYLNPYISQFLAQNLAEATGIDNLDDDRNGFVDDRLSYDFVNRRNFMIDDNSHGSHVAGIVAGINPEAQILPIKVLNDLGEGNLDDITDAIRYAVGRGAKVINLSLGAITRLSKTKVSYEAAVSWARLHGVLIVAAAGNAASDNDTNAVYPAGTWDDNVISVCATDNNGDLASFSNFGQNRVHLCAPGVEIVSAGYEAANPWVIQSGTSQATPMVSATAALLFSLYPNLKPYQVRDMIMESVRVVPGLTGHSQTSGVLSVDRAIKKVPPSL